MTDAKNIPFFSYIWGQVDHKEMQYLTDVLKYNMKHYASFSQILICFWNQVF